LSSIDGIAARELRHAIGISAFFAAAKWICREKADRAARVEQGGAAVWPQLFGDGLLAIRATFQRFSFRGRVRHPGDERRPIYDFTRLKKRGSCPVPPIPSGPILLDNQ
jgi:hypothetical protein